MSFQMSVRFREDGAEEDTWDTLESNFTDPDAAREDMEETAADEYPGRELHFSGLRRRGATGV